MDVVISRFRAHLVHRSGCPQSQEAGVFVNSNVKNAQLENEAEREVAQARQDLQDEVRWVGHAEFVLSWFSAARLIRQLPVAPLIAVVSAGFQKLGVHGRH